MSTAQATDLSVNLRRLMAAQGLTIALVVARSGLDQRTVKGMLAGRIARPHAGSLHKLAAGLGVAADELFVPRWGLAHRAFDRQTNPAVDEAIAARPELVAGWGPADFDELYSRFGAGGQLTAEGAAQAIEQMSRNREVLDKAALVLETAEGEMLRGFVELLYQRIAVRE